MSTAPAGGTAVDGAVAVVTGAAGGIGSALAVELVARGAGAVVLVDRVAPDAVARSIGDAPGCEVVAETVDLTEEPAVRALVARTVDRFGRIDAFFSNAGILTGIGVVDPDPDDAWQRGWDVNVMASVHVARAVLPVMLAQGGGAFCITASAAGLLTAPGDAVYTATKHAAVGLAEWLEITYADRGIRVSVVCPFGVATPMLLEPLAAGEPAAQVVAASGEVLSPARVAGAVLDGVAEGRFLITPHPEVATYWAQKAGDVQRWLAGVRRLTRGHGLG